MNKQIDETCYKLNEDEPETCPGNCSVHSVEVIKYFDHPNQEYSVQVTPNLCQSVADYEANMQFDEMRDNEL